MDVLELQEVSLPEVITTMSIRITNIHVEYMENDTKYSNCLIVMLHIMYSIAIDEDSCIIRKLV